ncbi:THAP domain [Popillia japonica]|uniref:THAP domain n=1 Tax=Popillia japonica TaxID=7064 RepID=A0AAW1K1J6_POPJA
MPGCAVNACGNYNRATKGSNIRYYRFPKDKALAKQWIAAYQGFYIDGKSLFITKDSIQKLLEVANSELTICPKINSSHLELTGPQRQRVQKLVRNHFLDQGFYIDGKSITKDSIQKLLEVANSELTICPKINSSHLELTGPQRQRVRPAAQLLSHSRTVAKALEYCGTNNMLPATNWRDTSNFILMINDWFDVHNSTSKFCGNNPTKNAFGIDLDNQEKILDNISSTMEQMIVGKHKSLISFQKGIILSNRSQGFYIDGKSITKDSIQKLLEVANSELTICPKINSSHLELTGPQRQRVRPAAQLLSRTVAKALEYCGTNNMLPATNWRDTSNFILMINDWFDVHNSTSKFCGNNPTKNAFGIDLDNQEKILDNISSTMEQMIVGKHKSLISFQKGIILSNRSLKELYKHCNKEYGVEYLLTRRLNQDVFDEQCLLSSLETVDAEDGAECGNDTCLTESLMQNLSLRFVIIEDIDEEPAEEFCFIEPEYPVLALPENTNIANLGTLTQFEAQQKIDDEALIYIAGYVAFKFKHKYNLGEPWKNLTIP